MPEYKYKRICELTRCSKPFQTNRKDQRFHEDSCRIEWHQTQKSEVSDILRRLDALEKENKGLKEKYNLVCIKIKAGVASQNKSPDLPGKEVNDQKKKRPSSNGEEGA